VLCAERIESRKSVSRREGRDGEADEEVAPLPSGAPPAADISLHGQSITTDYHVSSQGRSGLLPTCPRMRVEGRVPER
jgi:hypothetical protein